jgi:hypothetical protein
MLRNMYFKFEEVNLLKIKEVTVKNISQHKNFNQKSGHRHRCQGELASSPYTKVKSINNELFVKLVLNY